MINREILISIIPYLIYCIINREIKFDVCIFINLYLQNLIVILKLTLFILILLSSFGFKMEDEYL